MQHFIIAKNTSYQLLTRVVTSFIGFLITIIIARNFGVVGYGDFIKVTSYVALFYLVVDFGLNAFFLQYQKAEFKNLFYLRTLIALLLFLVLNLVTFLFPYDQVSTSGFSDATRIGIFIFSFSVFSQSIILSASAMFQKTLNYFSYMIGICIGTIFNLTLVLIFAFLNFPMFYIYLSFVVSSLLSGAILLKLTKEKIFPFSFDESSAKEIFIKSLPIGLMLIFNLVYFRVDIFLLSVLSSTKDVGVYGLSYKFFDFLIAIPLFLSNSLYPFLIQAKDDRKSFLNITKKYFVIFLVLSLVIAVPFWFASPLFVAVKDEFISSVLPFRILLLSLPFFFVTSLLQWVLITLGKQKYLMYVYLFATSLNILLNVIFIPQFSYIASSAITVVTEGIVFILLMSMLLFNKNLFERGLKNNG